MKALCFYYSLPRLAASRIASLLWKDAYFSKLSPLRMVELPEPELPADDWVKVRPRLTGICGSDIKQVQLKGNQDNPLTALISFPHVLGHETVGIIDKIGPGVKDRHPGERVVINPWLSCTPRGIDPPCSACQAGDLSLCRNFDRGRLTPGLHLGNNNIIPGAYSEAIVCHESQCHPVPNEVKDENAVLADPFSVSLHSILQYPPDTDAPVLVYGQGVIGMLAVTILRKLYPEIDIYVIARYPHQVERAAALGAKIVMTGRPLELIQQVAELTSERLRQPWQGLPWLIGGVGTVYDTIGSPESVETAIRLLRTRGKLVIAGVEAPRRFEWTPIYFKELQIIGSNAFGYETFHGEYRHAFDIFLEMARGGLDLSDLITHHFPLEDWRGAFKTLMHKINSKAIKVTFDINH